jgi:hypothetical protein
MTKCQKCENIGYYGFKENKERYCLLHKTPEMIDRKNKTCKQIGCNVHPCFGIKGGQAEYCLLHKTPEMIDIKNKICEYVNCTIRACYGIKNGKVEYCKEHKIIDMVDLRHKLCLEETCSIRACYGVKGTKLTQYCSLHKKEGMVDITRKTCLHENCTIRPNYGIKGENPEYCKKHKSPEMIDVVNKTCKYENCDVQPCYGLKNGKPEYCLLHKAPEMIDIVNKICKYKDCTIRASYGIKGTKQVEYCKEHKNPQMVDVINKSCKNDWCETIVTKKYDGYCYFCFVHMFPDHELTKSYKTKEKTVVDFVKSEFPDIDFICDKQIYDGCSKKRPDMFADFGDWVLIIEVDENEHIGYTCENKRLMQLSQDINHRPLTMIRFNPDKYTKDGVKIGSCWRNDKNGTKIVKTKANEWTERLERLKSRIQRVIDNPSDQTIKLYNLFFSK